MGPFLGTVILESLTDDSALSGWPVLLERVQDVPDDPDATVWHVRWYHVGEEALLERLPALAAATRTHWYSHFWRGDDLYVIMAGRFFRDRVSDRSTWAPFIAYGD